MVTFRANIYGPLDGGMVILKLFAAETFFIQRNFIANFVRLKLNFIRIKTKKSFFSHHLGDLGVTYALHLLLVGKTVVDFIFVIIELFRYLLRLRRYKQKSVEVGVFLKWRVILTANFRQKGASPTKQC